MSCTHYGNPFLGELCTIPLTFRVCKSTQCTVGGRKCLSIPMGSNIKNNSMFAGYVINIRGLHEVKELVAWSL